MDDPERYRVVLMPTGELLAPHCTLREAAAFVHGYQEASPSGRSEAVIACEEREPLNKQQLTLMGSSRRQSRVAGQPPVRTQSVSA